VTEDKIKTDTPQKLNTIQ